MTRRSRRQRRRRALLASVLLAVLAPSLPGCGDDPEPAAELATRFDDDPAAPREAVSPDDAASEGLRTEGLPREEASPEDVPREVVPMLPDRLAVPHIRRITLESSQAGDHPPIDYSVEVRADGLVVYRGVAGVRHLGTQTRKINLYEWNRLTRLVDACGLWYDWGDWVLAGGSHAGSATVTVEDVDGRESTVEHHAMVAMTDPLCFWVVVRVLQAMGEHAMPPDGAEQTETK